MEENKSFKSIGGKEIKSPSSNTKYRKPPGIVMTVAKAQEILNNAIVKEIGKGTKIRLVKTEGIDYDSITDFKSVMNLEKENSDIIIDFVPPLFNKFITKDNKINPRVNIGDKVYYNMDENVKGEVLDLKFRGLDDLTVIVASVRLKIDNEEGNTIDGDLDIFLPTNLRLIEDED